MCIRDRCQTASNTSIVVDRAGGGISRSSVVDTNSSVQWLLCQLQHDAQVLGMAVIRVLYQV